MDIAKIIRNANTNQRARMIISRDLIDYFERIDPLCDRKSFMQIANGAIEFDPHTEWCSELKEKNDDNQA